MAANGVQIARAAVVKVAQILSGQRIAVTQRGELAFCEADDDGRPTRINLPFLPDDASERVLRATQGYLDHEVGHALFTDFASVRKAADESALLKMLHNLVEDTLIERRMAARFRGSAYNLEETRRFVLEEHCDPVLEQMPGAGESELFPVLLMPVVRAWAGQEAMVDYMADKWDLVAGHSALFADLVDRFATVADSWQALDLAREMLTRLERGAPETYGLMTAQAEAAEAALAAAAAGGAQLVESGAAGPEGARLFEDALARALKKAVAAERAESGWRVFTTDFDLVEPMPLGGRDWSETLARMQRETEAMIGPMARAIERMVAAKRQAHWVGGRRRGRLHAAALHRAPQGDARLFRQRMESQARHAAVSLVVDMSGSMAGKRVWIACAAALALSETLTRAGVAHEAIGFTTRDPETAFDEQAQAELRREDAALRARSGRAERRRRRRMVFSRYEPLYLPLLKGFDERLSPAIRQRFAAAACRNDLLRNNIDHESIRQAGLRLAQRSEPRRAMIVFSDGEPAFDGDVTAGQKLLSAEVAALERAGLEVYGVGVESRSVETYYPRRIVIESVASLPEALMRLTRAVVS